MKPKLNGIDHVHVYVSNFDKAESWYREVMGFERVESLMSWAVEGGPLTVQDESGNIHLALFERPGTGGSSAIAFGTSGSEFLAWRTQLEDHGLTLRLTDHKLAYSLYFEDPDENLHEITTYDRDFVVSALAA